MFTALTPLAVARPVALGVSLTVGLPLLCLRHWHDPLASTFLTTIFPHSGLALFLVALGLGVWSLTQMTLRGQKNRMLYFLVGISLGLSPAIFFYIVSVVSQQPSPPFSIVVAGAITGTLAGLIFGRELPSLKNGNNSLNMGAPKVGSPMS